MVQVGGAKDNSHWASVFDGLCKMHRFPSPGGQVCVSHTATATLTLIGTLAGTSGGAKN